MNFMNKKNHDLKNGLASMEFVLRLAYLLDIFDTLNYMNMFFQSPNSITADLVSKLKHIYGSSTCGQQTSRPSGVTYLKNLICFYLQYSNKLYEEICFHLTQLKMDLMHYF